MVRPFQLVSHDYRSYQHRDPGIHQERVLCETFLQPFICRPEIGRVKNYKFGVRYKIFLFYKMVEIGQLTLIY